MRTFLARLAVLLLLVPTAPFASLRDLHEALRERLASSPFGQPLILSATEETRRVSGEVFAELPHPFAQAEQALANPGEWCEILMLPFNTKQCESSATSDELFLTVFVGRKYTTPIGSTHRLDFHFRVTRDADDMRVELTAPLGPFGTRAYLIVFELAPLDASRSFLHFSYSYEYGALARAAMQVYLSTIGARKVGFTTQASGAGEGALVRGMRGVMERNTMRYYLAIEAYLRERGAPAELRTARMIEDWFEAVERYPRQLHELDHDEYVTMKRAEYDRMHALSSRDPRTASSSP